MVNNSCECTEAQFLTAFRYIRTNSVIKYEFQLLTKKFKGEETYTSKEKSFPVTRNPFLAFILESTDQSAPVVGPPQSTADRGSPLPAQTDEYSLSYRSTFNAKRDASLTTVQL